MSAVASSFTTDIVQLTSEYEQHNTRLINLVETCGYKLCDIEGDGNCFSAIAFSPLTQQTILTAKLPTYFADKQLPMQASLPQLARLLRERTVEEWMHNH